MLVSAGPIKSEIWVSISGKTRYPTSWFLHWRNQRAPSTIQRWIPKRCLQFNCKTGTRHKNRGQRSIQISERVRISPHSSSIFVCFNWSWVTKYSFAAKTQGTPTKSYDTFIITTNLIATLCQMVPCTRESDQLRWGNGNHSKMQQQK